MSSRAYSWLLSSFILLTSTILSPVTVVAGPAAVSTARPKLFLVLVIDQFRADYLTRFESRFLAPVGKSGEVGGFRYLMSRGAYYPYAEYEILQSMTGPGHATVLTGSYPYQAGIPTNYWHDTEKGKRVYCTEDSTVAVVGSEPATARGGTSPRNLIGSTVGDELKNAGYPSRVVSLALKDRASILMGGHRADLAFWFDQKAVQWISSRYYLPEGKLPEWMLKLNKALLARKGSKVVWEATGPGTGFSAPGGSTVVVGDWWDKVPGLGKSFPHETVFGNWESFITPVGLEITADAAKEAFEAFQMGRGKSTDLFAVSFSSHDYGAHVFGANSREMEEMTVAEDRVISGFLNFVKKKLPGGLKDVVIVLTADHGAPPNPEWLKSLGVEAGRISEKAMVSAIDERLKKRFGEPSGGSWVSLSYDLNLYMNRKAVQDKKLDLAEVQLEAKRAIVGMKGIAQVFTEGEYLQRRLPPEMFERQILKTYMPGRSGDVVVIPRPFYMVDDQDAATHQTGYAYDRTVPLILAGPGVRTGVYATPAKVVDLAPTLTFMGGVVAPAASEGRVLSEILQQKH